MPAISPIYFSQYHSLQPQVVKYCQRYMQGRCLTQFSIPTTKVSGDSPAEVPVSAKSSCNCLCTTSLDVATCTNFPNRGGTKAGEQRSGGIAWVYSFCCGWDTGKLQTFCRAEMPVGNSKRNREVAEQNLLEILQWILHCKK